MTYSQRGEDDWVKAYFGDLRGRFLDIGAYDGKTFSNVRVLAEAGWEGVCVEPAAYPFSLLLEDPPPKTELVNAVVGEATGLVPFHQSKDAVSTTEDFHAKKWNSAAEFHYSYVMAISVADLLVAFPGPYDFISLDTEGTSMKLFQEFAPLLEKLETDLICVEHDGGVPQAQGFTEYYRTEENAILGRAQ